MLKNTVSSCSNPLWKAFLPVGERANAMHVPCECRMRNSGGFEGKHQGIWSFYHPLRLRLCMTWKIPYGFPKNLQCLQNFLQALQNFLNALRIFAFGQFELSHVADRACFLFGKEWFSGRLRGHRVPKHRSLFVGSRGLPTFALKICFKT